MNHSFAVVIEPAGSNFSAYVPDLPGCVATGATREDALEEIRSAIRFHLDGLQQDHAAPPIIHASVAMVEI
jgi:predicted RNase H-like HicB family nuclease